MELFEDFRLAVRRWLGISQLQKRVLSRLEVVEEKVAISQEDLDRLNAATSRIAARVTSLLDQVDALGSGNDDQVRQEQQIADVQEASSQLRPVLEQLEALASDATNVVPEPTPEQVPVEPGPDVAPVENGGVEAPPADGVAPGEAVGGVAPGEPLPEGANPGGDVQFDESGIATGEPAVADETNDGSVGGGETVPGPSGDDASPTQR